MIIAERQLWQSFKVKPGSGLPAKLHTVKLNSAAAVNHCLKFQNQLEGFTPDGEAPTEDEWRGFKSVVAEAFMTHLGKTRRRCWDWHIWQDFSVRLTIEA